MLTNQIAFLEEGEPFQAPLSCFSQHRYKEERNSAASCNCSQGKPLRSREELWSKKSLPKIREHSITQLLLLFLLSAGRNSTTRDKLWNSLSPNMKVWGVSWVLLLGFALQLACLAVVTPQKDGRGLHVLEGSYVYISTDICELDTEKGSFS